MIHINHLFEQKIHGTGDRNYLSEFVKNKILSNGILGAAKNAQCFFIENQCELVQVDVVPELVRLPYEICWFETSTGKYLSDKRIAALAVKHEQKILLICFQSSIDNRNKFYWEIIGSSVLSEFDSKILIQQAQEDQKEIVHFFSILISKFLSAMNCSNIIKVEHNPDEKLQKARIKRGKKPLFSYWTLQLSIPNEREEGASLGGTHASPRVHLRRGHARQYAPGKYTWVQPCAVGNKSLGVIHKDYAVKQGPH